MEGKTPDQLIQDSAVSNGVGVGNFVAQGWIQRVCIRLVFALEMDVPLLVID